MMAFLSRYNPGVWMVLNRPTQYIFDDRDKMRARELEDQAAAYRVQIVNETDWDTANGIIKKLLTIDATLCRMSIGFRIDGRDIYGEPL